MYYIRVGAKIKFTSKCNIGLRKRSRFYASLICELAIREGEAKIKVDVQELQVLFACDT